MTLANIRQKLEGRKYSNHKEFVYDFRTMFANVFIYYPPESKEYQKALELQDMFNKRWEIGESKLH